MNDKYILCEFDYLPSLETNFVQNNVINNTIKTSTVFDGNIVPAGCSEEVITQENHILSPVGGTTTPKNIVFQTIGSNSIYGSFFRDDTLTNPKGDIRGSGANDLSVSRDLCSQVASGAFSSILSGENNTSSGNASSVVGGNSNIADSSNCLVIGGISNISSGGLNNGIITGSLNATSRLRNDISNTFLDISNSLIITGSNIIMNGINSVFVTGMDISGSPIVPFRPPPRGFPERPALLPFKECAIITGLSNTIIPITLNNPNFIINNVRVQNIFIGTGNNIKSCQSHGILTGNNLEFGFIGYDQNTSFNSLVYTARNITNKGMTAGGVLNEDKAFTNNSFMSCSDISSNNSTRFFDRLGFLPGLSNTIGNNTGINCTNSLIGGRNNLINGSNNAVVTGSNIIFNNRAGYSNIICTGNVFNGVDNIPSCSAMITGSNHTAASGGGGNIRGQAFICGMQNFINRDSPNTILGAGSNNSNASTGPNNTIISGTNNSITTASNSVIASGTSNTIIGALTNSFMTGIAGLLSTPVVNSAAVFGQSNLQGATGTPSFNRIFMIGNGTGTRRNAFSVTENGVARANLTFVNGGADFAEYFETYESSSIYRLPLHETVCLIDDRFIGKEIINKQFISSLNGFKESDIGKIILSSQVPDEIIPFGVVTNNSSFIGNSYDEEWQGKYERDGDGRIIYEDVDKIEYEDIFDLSLNEIITFREERRISESGEVFYQKVRDVEFTEVRIPVMEEVPVYNESGQLLRTVEEPKKREVIVKINSKKISSQYNPNLIYVPRSKRPEWNLVALRGQVIIKKGQREIPDTIRLEEFGEFYDRYLI
jgi:hypothetical protein